MSRWLGCSSTTCSAKLDTRDTLAQPLPHPEHVYLLRCKTCIQPAAARDSVLGTSSNLKVHDGDIYQKQSSISLTLPTCTTRVRPRSTPVTAHLEQRKRAQRGESAEENGHLDQHRHERREWVRIVCFVHSIDAFVVRTQCRSLVYSWVLRPGSRPLRSMRLCVQ